MPHAGQSAFLSVPGVQAFGVWELRLRLTPTSILKHRKRMKCISPLDYLILANQTVRGRESWEGWGGVLAYCIIPGTAVMGIGLACLSLTHLDLPREKYFHFQY